MGRRPAAATPLLPSKTRISETQVCTAVVPLALAVMDPAFAHCLRMMRGETEVVAEGEGGEGSDGSGRGSSPVADAPDPMLAQSHAFAAGLAAAAEDRTPHAPSDAGASRGEAPLPDEVGGAAYSTPPVAPPTARLDAGYVPYHEWSGRGQPGRLSVSGGLAASALRIPTSNSCLQR